MWLLMSMEGLTCIASCFWKCASISKLFCDKLPNYKFETAALLSTKHKHPLQARLLWRSLFIMKLLKSSLQQKPVKMSSYEPIKVSWVLQMHKPSCNFSPPHKRNSHILLRAASESRGKTAKIKHLAILVTKPKQRLKTMCVCVYVFATWRL